MPHVSDEDVALYAARRLTGERLELVEEHFMDCAACLGRVQEGAALAEALRAGGPARRPSHTLAAAAAAACVLVAVGGLLVENRRLRRELAAPGDAPAATAPPPAAAPQSWPVLRVTPPERSGRAGTTRLSTVSAWAWLAVDASEAARPGSPVDVTLADAARGTRILHYTGLQVSETGTLLVPVATSSLRPGDYLVELRVGGELQRIPLRIVP